MKKIALREYSIKENIVQYIRNFSEITKKNKICIDETKQYLAIVAISYTHTLCAGKGLDLFSFIKEIGYFAYTRNNDMHDIYQLFSQAYDELYYDILFKKIILPKNVRTMLEMFASPLHLSHPFTQKKVLRKYFRSLVGKK